ncbi:MAG: hypothetical protein ABI895_04040 [Deltaproteobacteria bacterium]
MQSSLVLLMVPASMLTLHCESNGAKCAIADSSECGSPLPATQPGGEQWPTFSQALLVALACSSQSSLCHSLAVILNLRGHGLRDAVNV